MKTIRDYAYQTAKLPEFDSEPLVVMPLSHALLLDLALDQVQFAPHYRGYIEPKRMLQKAIARSKSNER